MKKIIKITRPDGKFTFAVTKTAAGMMLGCTKVFVGYVLSNKPEHSHYKKAKGCTLEHVSFEEAVRLACEDENYISDEVFPMMASTGKGMK